MVRPLLVLSAVALGAAGCKGPAEQETSLVGVWSLERGELGGWEQAVPAGGVVFEFTADGKHYIRDGKGRPDPGAYRVDPAQDPPHVDMTNPAGTHTMLGIYKVEGDTLTLCFDRGGGRPTKSESPAGSRVTLMTLKRAPKKD